MPVADYFDSSNLGPLNEFTGRTIATYREEHDENNSKLQTAINSLDGRAAVLEDEFVSAITDLAGSTAAASRITVNDFFAVSRMQDTLINTLVDDNDNAYLTALADVVGTFITSRWPGWMINKTMVDATYDAHRVGVPIKWGSASIPAAGIYKTAGTITGEPLFYQRLDKHYPITNLRGGTYTLICEYFCDIDDLFELFVKYGPAGGSVTELHSGSNDYESTGEVLLQTYLVFTVPEDADYVSVGLDFSQSNNGHVQLYSCYVAPGDLSASLPVPGLTTRRTFPTDLEDASHYWRRFAIRTYGDAEVISAGSGNDKNMHNSVPLGKDLIVQSTDEVQMDIYLGVPQAEYHIKSSTLAAALLGLQDLIATSIDFAATGPYDAPVEQDQAAQESDYTLYSSLEVTYILEAASAQILLNLPIVAVSGEVCVVAPDTI